MEQKDLSGRLARWSLKLQGFKFNIEYRKGSQNTVPDALSRVDNIDEVNETVDVNPLFIDLDSPAFLDPEYLNLIEQIKNFPKDVDSNLRVENGRVFILPTGKSAISDSDIPCWKLFVPQALTQNLIKSAHNPPTSAHMGVAKTLEVIQRKYFWPNMVREVKEFVNCCETCRTCKPVNYKTKPPMGDGLSVGQPWQRLYIDFLGPYPRSRRQNSYLLIVMDQYTRFVQLKPLRQATSTHLVDFLEHHVFSLFSVPESVFTDNGKQFKSKTFANLLNKYGVMHFTTPKYSPQPNASERANRTLLSSIRAYIQSDQKDWDAHIFEIASALRNVNHSSTGYSPHYLVYGEHKKMHGTDYRLLNLLGCARESDVLVQNKSVKLKLIEEKVLQNLKNAHDKNANRYNLRSNDRHFSKGDKVFVRNFNQSNAANYYSAKLDKKSIPAIINKPIGKVSYECVDEKGKLLGVYHLKDIFNWRN